MEQLSFKWTAIERMGNSKIAKSSYAWFIIIPIAAKLLQKVQNPIYITFLSEKPIEINVDLPFSWYIIFIIGILFILSNVIYLGSCPHIIREFKNYSSFTASGYPNSYLIEQADLHNIDADVTSSFITSIPAPLNWEPGTPKGNEYEREHQFNNSRKEYFDSIYNMANASKKLVRYFASIVIVIAFLLVAYIVYENVNAVIEVYNYHRSQ